MRAKRRAGKDKIVSASGWTTQWKGLLVGVLLGFGLASFLTPGARLRPEPLVLASETDRKIVEERRQSESLTPATGGTSEHTFGHIPLPPTSKRRLCGRVKVADLPQVDKRDVWMLKPHRQDVYDKTPRSGSWAMWLGPPEPGYLGRQGPQPTQGPRIPEGHDHIRIALPTVPRSGNHWFRDLWERATERTTGAVFDNPTQTFYDEACRIHLKKNQWPAPDCAKGEHALVKSHTPFQPLMHKDYRYDADWVNLTYAINIIRNPIDNRRGWDKFFSPRRIYMQEFAYLWKAHHSFWEDAGNEGLGRIVLRYEDMLIDVGKELKKALEAAPGDPTWTPESFKKAVNFRPPSKTFEEKCGESMGDLSHEEYVFMQERFGGSMRKYGYYLEFEPE